MHKRGNEKVAAAIILIVVLAVALVGVWYVTKPGALKAPKEFSTTGQAGTYVLPCITDADCLPQGRVCVKTSLRAGVCRYPPPGREITAYSTIPGVKAYGGSIRGVAIEGSKAFAGRAFELPQEQQVGGSCFRCNCPGIFFGVTAQNVEAVQRQCTGYCEGGVASVWHDGLCTDKEREDRAY